MKELQIVIVSGSCCNPALAGVDDKVKARVQQVANEFNVPIDIRLITISSAAFGGLGLGKQTGDAIKSLLSEKGLGILPIILFNGMIAFYGGVASAELVKQKMLEAKGLKS